MKTKYSFALGLVLLLSILSISPVFSQIVRYGLKAGVDVADHKVNSNILNVKNRVGFQIGGTLELNVPLTGFGVETGLSYGNKNYNVDNVEKQGDIKNLNYLTVPISLKKRFSILGVAGIYVSAGVYGNLRLGGGELTIDGVEYGQKKAQTGFVAGLGVSLLNHLDLGMNYRYKFTDTYDQEAAHDFRKVDRQTWTVSLAYLF
ncbi:porin family protein [Prevotella sp. 10(H)]|uniref:porin family protein n=1 Tax=Prevotella sp. 10(H) TaxID=1158294 RepID=UPI0004A6DFA1|nr:porin family protein [Prevotella sp. 10(H)]